MQQIGEAALSHVRVADVDRDEDDDRENETLLVGHVGAQKIEDFRTQLVQKEHDRIVRQRLQVIVDVVLQLFGGLVDRLLVAGTQAIDELVHLLFAVLSNGVVDLERDFLHLQKRLGWIQSGPNTAAGFCGSIGGRSPGSHLIECR